MGNISQRWRNRGSSCDVRHEMLASTLWGYRWYEQQVSPIAFGPDPAPNWCVANLSLRDINRQKQWIQVQSEGNVPTSLNWAGCQRIVQRVHLKIYMMLLFLLRDNCILLKLHIEHWIITFCLYSSLHHQLFWNPCFSIYIGYFAYQRGDWVCYELKYPCDALITLYARTKIVDVLMTVVFIMG